MRGVRSFVSTCALGADLLAGIARKQSGKTTFVVALFQASLDEAIASPPGLPHLCDASTMFSTLTTQHYSARHDRCPGRHRGRATRLLCSSRARGCGRKIGQKRGSGFRQQAPARQRNGRMVERRRDVVELAPCADSGSVQANLEGTYGCR